MTTPFDINDRGAIAGAYAVGSADAPESAVFHGFLRRPSGAVITVDVPGASATGASGINHRGAVVGTYEDSRGTGHGFLLHRGMVTPIDPPDAKQDATFGNIAASDINDHGEIVAFYPDARGTYQGFLYHTGQFTELDPPQAAGNRNGFGASAPFGINNRGQVVGQYVDADGSCTGYLSERKRGLGPSIHAAERPTSARRARGPRLRNSGRGHQRSGADPPARPRALPNGDGPG